MLRREYVHEHAHMYICISFGTIQNNNGKLSVFQHSYKQQIKQNLTEFKERKNENKNHTESAAACNVT